MNKTRHAAIIDVATSGFSPDKSYILEVAAFLVGFETLEIEDAYHGIVLPPDEAFEKLPEMHLRNGLAEECIEKGRDVQAIEGELLAGPWGQAMLMVNARTDFDRRFIAKHMPTFAAELPKRWVDLTDVAWLSRRKFEPEITKSFRAVDDALLAHAELKCYFG